MLNLSIPIAQLIKEETETVLILARPNILRLWGAVALILGIITGAVVFTSGYGLIGWLVTVVYVGFSLLLLTSRRSVSVDITQQTLFFTTHYLFFDHQTRFFHFDKIDKVFLDFESQHQEGIFVPRMYTRRKWFIFVTLKDERTVTLVRHYADYPVDQEPNLHNETQLWEKLAKKIAAATGKLLITTATVPSRAPRTFVDVIDQIVQRHLTALPQTDPLSRHTIRLRSHPNGHMEIVVNGEVHHALDELNNENIRQLIQLAIDEWHGPQPLPQSMQR
ncbi:MAG: hypothetical protein KDJ52_07015 [Anaerolineae bacterium]|nr:hypothetical protein [Anaerolineae bacterium]